MHAWPHVLQFFGSLAESTQRGFPAQSFTVRGAASHAQAPA